MVRRAVDRKTEGADGGRGAEDGRGRNALARRRSARARTVAVAPSRGNLRRERTAEPREGAAPPAGVAGPPEGAGRAGQTKNCPPLAEMVEPVMNPAWSETRKTTQRAISSGSPSRPVGIWAMIDSRTFSGTAITISVAM